MANYAKKRNDINDFTKKELQIVEEFLFGKSIRQLQKDYEEYGRTAIRNVLEDYIRICPEKSEVIKQLLYKNKNHKDFNREALREISTEEIELAYEQIMSGVTLTQISIQFGRTRDYIKNRIIEYLNDSNEIENFMELLSRNQNTNNKDINKMFLNLSDKEKKDIIFEKLNNRRKKHGKNVYSHQMLERKFVRLKKYFLNERNSKISDDRGVLLENSFWKMLYDNPYLLSYSLSDKIKPAMRNLDENLNIGYSNATNIISENSSILAASISRTNLQIQLLQDNDLLNVFLKKPRYFRTSPEMMYALIKLNKEKGKTTDIFITKTRLMEEYGMSDDDIKKSYPIKNDDRYGDYEYFD